MLEYKNKKYIERNYSNEYSYYYTGDYQKIIKEDKKIWKHCLLATGHFEVYNGY